MIAPSADEPPRTAWQLIHSRDFGVFFGARLATAVGTWLFSVTSMIAAFEASQSALLVGIVSAVQFLPQLLLGPVAGQWTDRGSVKLQMMLGRGMLSLAALGLGAWYLWAPSSSQSDVTALLVCSLVFGFGLVVGGPAMQSAGPELVRRSELPSAMALSTAPMTVGRIAGPAIGAVTAGLYGYHVAFVLSGLLSISFIALVAGIRFPALPDRLEGDKYRMAEAFAFLARDRPALFSLIGVTAVGVGMEPLITLAPALVDSAGADSPAVGVLVSALGVGAAGALLLMSALAPRLRQERVASAGLLIMAASLLACVVPMSLSWMVVPFVGAGIGFIVAQAALSTILQVGLPSLLRGRIMALWLIGFVGSRPIGAVIVGGVADASSVYVAFACTGGAMLIAAAVCRPSKLRRASPGQPPSRALPDSA